MSVANMISISTGKDSVATWLLAIEREVPNIYPVFADVGNESEKVYEYLPYLEDVMGTEIKRVMADFTKEINDKRQRLIDYFISFDSCHSADRYASGYIFPILEAAIAACVPSGNPYLDLCIWKGRFPSSQAQFCTEELKVKPITDQVVWPLLREFDTVESWQGIRKEESKRRSKMVEREGIEPDATRVFAYRPILEWKVADVFAMHQKHGVKPNPLYSQGMSRVGCMPCVNADKAELREIAYRFPEELKRIAEWERLVSQASKQGSTTMFCATNDPTVKSTDDIHFSTHGIDRMVAWSGTKRGGRQVDLIATDPVAYPECSSRYGLCGD